MWLNSRFFKLTLQDSLNPLKLSSRITNTPTPIKCGLSKKKSQGCLGTCHRFLIDLDRSNYHQSPTSLILSSPILIGKSRRHFPLHLSRSYQVLSQDKSLKLNKWLSQGYRCFSSSKPLAIQIQCPHAFLLDHPEWAHSEPVGEKEFDKYMECVLSLEDKIITTIIVAVSGGPDSLALALLLHRWHQSRIGKFHHIQQPTPSILSINPIKIICVTVNHQLRSEALEECHQVGEWMENQKMPHQILELDWPQSENPQSAIQDLARQKRYQALLEFSEKLESCHFNRKDPGSTNSSTPTERGSTLIVTAHTLDDNIETFFMRISRLSGVDGLAGIAIRRKLSRHVDLCRPCLTISKARLQATLLSFRHPWIIDPSNENIKYRRTQIRLALKAFNQQGIEKTINHVTSMIDSTPTNFQCHSPKNRMNTTLVNLHALSQLIDPFIRIRIQNSRKVSTFCQRYVQEHRQWACLMIPLNPFSQLEDSSLKSRIIQSLINHIGGGFTSVRTRTMDMFLDILKDGDPKARTIGKCWINFKRGKGAHLFSSNLFKDMMIISKKPIPIKKTEKNDYNEEESIKWYEARDSQDQGICWWEGLWKISIHPRSRRKMENSSYWIKQLNSNFHIRCVQQRDILFLSKLINWKNFSASCPPFILIGLPLVTDKQGNIVNFPFLKPADGIEMKSGIQAISEDPADIYRPYRTFNLSFLVHIEYDPVYSIFDNPPYFVTYSN